MSKGEDKEAANAVPANEAGSDRSSKKPYQSPQLRIYGNVKNLTQSVLKMGNKFDDATSTSHFKTG